MARYSRVRTMKFINEGLDKLPTYFLALDMAAYIRDVTGKNQNVREIRNIMLAHQVAQVTPVKVRRGGSEFTVMKKYGADDPPDDWEYGGRQA